MGMVEMTNDIETTPRPTESQAEALLAVVDKDILSKHINLAQKQEEAYWCSGELSIELQEIYYPEYSKAAIRKAVGEIYSISINTVRDRERISEAVPIELRNAVPFLKFSHWRNIIPAGQEKANNMLWESVAMFEAEGKGPTVDQVLAWRGNESMDATPPWIYRLQDGMEKMEMVRDDPRSDPQIRIWFGETIEKVEKRAELLKLGRFKLAKENNDRENISTA